MSIKTLGSGIALVLVLSVLFAGCFREYVPPGYAGVIVNTWGGDRGAGEVVGNGYHWLSLKEDMAVKFPLSEQNYAFTRDQHEGTPADEAINFQNAEGLTLSGDFAVRYQVRPSKVDTLFRKYRQGLEYITQSPIRNVLREAINEEASRYDVEAIIGQGKPALMDSIKARMNEEFLPVGIEILSVSIIGDFRVPERVQTAIDDKINATQRAEQAEIELRESRARARADSIEAAGAAVARRIEAAAEAEANREVAASITPTLVQYIQAQKWNGEMPQYVGGSDGMIMLQPNR